MNTILFSDDINLLSHWEKAITAKHTIVDELDDLYTLKSSLVILNYSACLGKCDKILTRLNKEKNRVLILHRTPTFETAKEMLKLGAYGYGNAMMRDHFIIAAINAIEEGMVWLYPEFTSQLIMDVPSQKGTDIEKFLMQLSEREKETALLLKDGYSYKDIAEKLDITPRTVKAHAQQIYVKLQVKDRLALALLLK